MKTHLLSKIKYGLYLINDELILNEINEEYEEKEEYLVCSYSARFHYSKYDVLLNKMSNDYFIKHFIEFYDYNPFDLKEKALKIITDLYPELLI